MTTNKYNEEQDGKREQYEANAQKQLKATGISMSFGVSIFEDASAAVKAGYSYREPITPLNIKHAVIVRKGTESGGATVDLILEDANGNQFVTMTTANLLKMLPL